MTKKSQLQGASFILGMIPARYASSRFPGKILASIAGKSLLQRTYENARRCASLDQIVIATDDDRIYNHAVSFGAKAVMTSVTCPTGTDRLVEGLQKLKDFDHAQIIINIQGDEPCVDPKVIQDVGNALKDDSEAVMSTAAVKIHSEEEFLNPSIVKCVVDRNGNALYFSRAPLTGGLSGKWRADLPVYRHMGIYAFRRDFLMRYGKIPMTPLQAAEDLEQLKVLEMGYKIKVAIAEEFSIGVDHPEDIKKVEKWLCKQNMSL